jgi:putative superfamily III holin-X
VIAGTSDANAIGMVTRRASASDGSRVASALRHIADDLKIIASDELELGHNKLAQHFQHTISRASMVLLGGIVALIGLGMLCMVVVAALAPVMPLWLRLLVMAIVYMAIGGGLAAYFGARLKKTGIKPDLSLPMQELRDTAHAVEKGLH